MSVSAANDAVSVPLAYELYLPESWARDRARRRRAGVPPAVPFRPKWQIALAHILALQAEGVPPAPAYAFLAAERATLSPPEPLSFLRPARLPKGFKPRGASGAA